MSELDYLEQIASTSSSTETYVQSIEGSLNRLQYDFLEYTTSTLSLNENILYTFQVFNGCTNLILMVILLISLLPSRKGVLKKQ